MCVNEITQTQQWLKTVVIGHQLCPFASQVFNTVEIRYCINKDKYLEHRLQALIAECMHLDNQPTLATTLFISLETLNDFDDFLDFFTLAEDLLITQGYEGIYQLASFHPNYCFAETDANDPSNYTNRSPYPMLHILREASIEQALASYPDPENIPDRNIALTRQLGNAKLQALLSACLQPKK